MVSEMRVPNDILLPQVRQMVQEGHTVTLRVRGVSMRPFLEDMRDKVVLAPFRSLSVGDVVLAEIRKGHFVLHRIISVNGSHIVLRGDGNNVGTEKSEYSDVAALAVAFIRKERKYLVTNRPWKTYSKVWMNIGPMRRILLGVYRRMPVLQK